MIIRGLSLSLIKIILYFTLIINQLLSTHVCVFVSVSVYGVCASGPVAYGPKRSPTFSSAICVPNSSRVVLYITAFVIYLVATLAKANAAVRSCTYAL